KRAAVPTARHPDEIAQLGLALAKTPADPMAIEHIESDRSSPRILVLAAADALRLEGQHGRARALVLRALAERADGADAIAADVLRRAGDAVLATKHAQRALDRDDDPDHRARASLARIAFDRGQIEEAASLTANVASARVAEVAALVAFAQGDH